MKILKLLIEWLNPKPTLCIRCNTNPTTFDLHTHARLYTKENHEMFMYCLECKLKNNDIIPSLVDHRSDASIYRTVYNKPEPDAIRHAIWFIDNPQPSCLQEQP